MILIASNLLAQPTITSIVVPDTGTISTFRFFNGEVYQPGDSGANVTWDFSGVQTNATGILVYKDPASMPGANKFPSANLGVDEDGDPLIYLLTDNDQLSQVGLEYSGISENYSNNPKELMRFPITYGTVYTDSFEGTATVAQFNADRKGTIEIVGDGHGTLILPYATMNNVLRVRTVSNYEDRFLGQLVNQGTDTVYTWYVDGINEYVYNWYHLTGTQVPNAYHGAYLDTMFVGVNEGAQIFKGLVIAPNPAKDVVQFSFELDSKESVSLEIYSLQGNLVYQESFVAGSMKVIHDIDISGYDSGIYSVQLSSGNDILRKKFLVY